MAASDLTPIIQLPLDAREAQLVCWCLAQAGAIADGNTTEQLNYALIIKSLVDTMRGGEYNSLVSRLDKLIKAGIPDAVFHAAPECTHCACDDRTCCWCGKEKP